MGDPRVLVELCCGEPMVHNTWAGRWECGRAYFVLLDAGWDGGDPRDAETGAEVPVKADILELVTADDLMRWRDPWSDGRLVPDLEHWRASWRPDEGSVADAVNAACPLAAWTVGGALDVPGARS